MRTGFPIGPTGWLLSPSQKRALRASLGRRAAPIWNAAAQGSRAARESEQPVVLRALHKLDAMREVRETRMEWRGDSGASPHDMNLKCATDEKNIGVARGENIERIRGGGP